MTGVHLDDETLHDYSLDDRHSGDDRQKLTTIIGIPRVR